MEIFQTIWNALTTENEILTKIVSIPLALIESLVTTLLFTTILKISSTKKQKLLYVFSFSLIAIISMYFIPTPYNTFLNVLACPILVYIIFKTNILKSILAEIIPYLFFVIINSILYKILVNLFPEITIEFLLKIPILKILCSLIMYAIIFIIYKIFNFFNISIPIFEKNKRKFSKFIFINLILGTISISLQLYLSILYGQILSNYTTLLSIIVLFIYFLTSIYSLIRTNKLELTTKQLEEEQLYNKTLNILYDNIRGFKHDFQNIMQALGGYITANNMEGLQSYYKDLLPDSLEINTLDVLNPDTINNPAVYSILTEKYHLANTFGINISIDAFMNMDNINMKTYELTRVLGILLDNAIDASKQCSNKQINITIRKDDKVNRQLFIIENTYSNKDVDTDRIFEKGYTSKGKENKQSHGLGLWEVRKILKRNNNLNLYTTKTNEYFKQQLEIY